MAADLYTRQSNFDDAARLYEEMISKIEGTDEYYFDLAAIYLYKNDLDNALETYNRLQETYGINELSTFQKQKIFLKQNKIDEAIQEGRKLIEAYPNEEGYVISLVEIMLSNERTNQAIEELEKLLDINPSNSHARLLLSEAYKKIGDLENANKNLSLAFEDPALDVNAKAQVVNEYLGKLNDPTFKDFALKLANIIVETHPDKAISYTTLANLYLELKESEKAAENYYHSAMIDGSNFAVWQNLLNLESQLDWMDSVITHSEQALELFPNQNALYYYNGIANYQKSNFQEAIYALEQGKKLSKSNQELINLFNSLLGDSYYQVKEFEKSDKAYEAVLEKDPNNDVVLNNYSYYLSIRKERLEEAKKMSARLVKRNPDNPTYLDTHAWVLYNLGEYKEARKFMEKAIASAEANAIHHEHYGDILYKLGDIDSAVKQWQIAKGMNSTSDLIDKKIADRKLYE